MARLSRTPLAWLNLTHDRVRFGLFILGIVFAVVLMYMQIGFRNALLDSNTLLPTNLNADLILVSPNRRPLPLREPISRHRLTQTASVPGVRAVLPMYLENGLGQLKGSHPDPEKRKPSQSIRVIGVDPSRHLLKLPELDPNDARYMGDRIMVPNTALFDKFSRKGDRPGESVFGPLREGTSTELAGQNITLVGGFELGPNFTTEGTLIVSEQTFAKILRAPYTLSNPLADVDLGLVRLQPGVDVKRVQEEIRTELQRGMTDPDVEVLTVAELVEREEGFWLENTPIGFAFKFGMFMGIAVGMVIVYQILSGDVADHLPEYATLKAVGYPNRFLAWVVIQESLILAACGFVIGTVIAAIAYTVLTQLSGMPLRMTWIVALSVGVLTVVMCVASGLIALVKLIRADPADVFG